MCKWGPSRYQEGGNVGHILIFLEIRYRFNYEVFERGPGLESLSGSKLKGPYFQKIEMRCIFEVAKCVSGDPLGSERVAMLAIY